MLQVKEAWGHTLGLLHSIRGHLLALALRHQHTPMVARTHGQQALPTTFGYKVAVWVDEIDRHLARFDEARERVLVGNLTGAVGTWRRSAPRASSYSGEPWPGLVSARRRPVGTAPGTGCWRLPGCWSRCR